MKMTMLAKAIKVAVEAHADQFRSNGEPYIAHPIAVMNKIKFVRPDDEELLAIAVLHDVMEDTDYSYCDCLGDFSRRVADGVYDLTKKGFETYPQFIDRIINSGNMDAIIVKICDIEHNSSDLDTMTGDPEKIQARKVKYAEAKEKLYEAWYRHACEEVCA